MMNEIVIPAWLPKTGRELDLTLGTNHVHPEWKKGVLYLVLSRDGNPNPRGPQWTYSWELGIFSWDTKTDRGWFRPNGLGAISTQYDKPGTNSSSILRIWELDVPPFPPAPDKEIPTKEQFIEDNWFNWQISDRAMYHGGIDEAEARVWAAEEYDEDYGTED